MSGSQQPMRQWQPSLIISTASCFHSVPLLKGEIDWFSVFCPHLLNFTWSTETITFPSFLSPLFLLFLPHKAVALQAPLFCFTTGLLPACRLLKYYQEEGESARNVKKGWNWNERNGPKVAGRMKMALKMWEVGGRRGARKTKQENERETEGKREERMAWKRMRKGDWEKSDSSQG